MAEKMILAQQKYIRISPKKVNPMLKLVRNKSAREAARILQFDDSKAAKLAAKVLKTAVSNAINERNLQEEDLMVARAVVNEGPRYKARRISGRHFNILRKRSSHIQFGLMPVEKKPEATKKVSSKPKAKATKGKK